MSIDETKKLNITFFEHSIKVALLFFEFSPVSCPNFIHAWKYECNMDHLKSMYGPLSCIIYLEIGLQ